MMNWNSVAMCVLALTLAVASGCACCTAAPKAAVAAEPAPTPWRGGIASPSDLPVGAAIAPP